MPKKFVNLLRGDTVRRVRRASSGAGWMRQQLVKMVSLNQGLVSMSVGR